MVRAFTRSYDTLSDVLKSDVCIAAHSDDMASETAAFTAQWVALWDTGAQSCVITPKVVAALGFFLRSRTAKYTRRPGFLWKLHFST
jgi:hypothetical protein